MPGTLGASAAWNAPHLDPKCICNECFDVEMLKKFLPFFEKLFSDYFRAQFVDVENIPLRAEGEPPIIFVANHGGMTLPWDMMMLETGLTKLYRERGVPFFKKPRTLGASVLSETPQMRLFFLPDIWRNLGVVDATFLNFDSMMKHSYDLILCPEGVAGISKGYSKRYQLQPFSSSFVRLAKKYGATVVPVSVVNAEHLSPFGFSIRPLNRLVWRVFGMPFYPISPLAFLGSLFPFLGYSVLPAKLTYVFGKPIKFAVEDHESLPKSLVMKQTRDIQAEMAQNLDEAVGRYGGSPYRLGEFMQRARFGVLPFVWPWTAIKLWDEVVEGRQNTRSSPASRIIATAFYFIPILGWLLLYIRGLGLLRKKGFLSHVRKNATATFVQVDAVDQRV